MTVINRPRKIRQSAREAIGQFPIYWDCAADAFRAINFALQVQGYDLVVFQSILDKLTYEKWDREETKTFTPPIADTQHCLFFSVYKTPITGRYEVTTYISF